MRRQTQKAQLGTQVLHSASEERLRGIDLTHLQFRRTVIVRVLVADWIGALESWTRALKLKVPVAEGLPVSAPVPALSDSPGGSEPLAIDHV